MTASAGWYSDPAGGPDRYRWWDGNSWTRYLSTDPGAPAPAVEVAAQAGRESSGGTAVATDPGPAVEQFAPPTGRPILRPHLPGYEEMGQRPRRAAGSRRRWWLGTVAVGVVLLALVVAILIIREERQLLTPAPTGAPSSPPPTASYDDVTREVVAGALTVTLPDDPFIAYTTDEPGRVLENGVDAFAPVHENYDDDGNDWAVSISVGFVPEEQRGSTLKETVRMIYRAYLQRAYGGAEVQTKKRDEFGYTDEYPHPVRAMTADAHYSIDSVPSSYDDVSVLVVDNEDGSYSALVAARPNKQSQQQEESVTALFQSIRVTG